MKKLIKITVAISLMTMILVGCGTNSVDNTNSSTLVENTNSTQIQDDKTATENNFSNESMYILYENFDIGFSTQIPSSWEGKYSIVELEDTTWKTVLFYHNASVDEKDAGWLFSFSRLTGDKLTQDELPRDFILEQRGGYTYVVGFPTDVQYNEEPGSESAKEYIEMSNQVDLLINTFKVIEK